MRKTLTYSSFIITSLLVILAFVTATTYTQLGIAIVLYPIVAFFAYKLFIVRDAKTPAVALQPPTVQPIEKAEVKAVEPKKDDVSIKDIDKRAFLKLIGATGISFFLFSLFNRRTEALYFGRSSAPGISVLTDDKRNKINPAERNPTDGFQISEIDDRDIVFYGFINTYGAWYIM